MPFSTVQIFAVLALGGLSIRGFERNSVPYTPRPLSAPANSRYEAAHRGLAPAWLDGIPKYVCDHAEVSLELSEPSEFGPRWFTVTATNLAGGLVEGTCLVDTRRGPRIIQYTFTPKPAPGVQP
jgi:hypothetical protein